MIIGIAWRNIWRNKKRSLVILTAIALGLCGGLFAVGIMIGMAESMVDTAVNCNLAHIQIHTRSFKENADVNNFIPNAEGIAVSIRSIADVNEVSSRIIVEGMASSPSTNLGVKITGIDPLKEASVTTIATNIIEGKYLNSTGKNEAIIGRKLAEKLNLRLRSKIVLSFPGCDGSIVYGAFRISGIFETESTMFDKFVLFVKSDDLKRLLANNEIVNEIAVRLKDAKSIPGTLEKIKIHYPQLVVESWKDLSPELKITAELTNVMMLLFLGIILFALLFGITNTMLMSILDRVREFGMLMAIGMKRKRIFIQIILETFYLSVFGSAVGIISGITVINITNRIGINLSLFAEGLSVYGISSILYPFIPFEIYIELVILVLLTALVAAVYPGLKATRLKPAESIRTYH